ncbi:MAG: transporter [Flavobacteriales bacterium]|nr:transporter [Flavobacteriales bacterium]
MKKLLLTAFISISISNLSLAQCCSAGNPSTNNGAFGLSKNVLNVSSSILHSYSDTYFKGNQSIDWNYLKNMRFNFAMLSLEYGLTSKIKLTSEMGYFIDKSLRYGFIDQKRKAFGLGDLVLGFQYHLYNNRSRMITISPGMKVSFPIGAFDQMNGNIILPIDIQPSSGSFKLNPTVLITKQFPSSKLSASSFLSGEFSQRINTERTHYKYGNLYRANLKLIYQSSEKLNLGIALHFQHRNKAENKNEIMQYTGGSYLDLQPSFSYTLKQNYTLNTFIGIPIYKNVNGIQLTNKYSLGFGISKSFHLKTLKPQIAPDIL